MNKKIVLIAIGAYLLGSYFPLSSVTAMFKKSS